LGIDGSYAAMSPISIANWLADEASTRGITKDTLSSLRTGISTMWTEQLLPGPNPTHGEVVERVITGYGKEHAAEEAAARRLRKAKGTIALTVDLLAELVPAAGADRPQSAEEELYWAGACVATFALSRCIELFGATRIQRKPIRADAITFYDDARQIVARAVRPHDAADLARFPHHFVLHLGATKADQYAKNRPLAIAAAAAVEALWTWMHTRARLGGAPDSALFGLPGAAALAREHILERVASWVQVTHGGRKPTVTGKAFRRGGNQSLLASGASLPDIMAAGRWSSERMPGVYGSDEAVAARALLTSQAMGRGFSAAAAANSKGASR
jgi:hypothetical protein